MVALSYGYLQGAVQENVDNFNSQHPRYDLINDASGRTVINEGANRLILHAIAKDRRSVNCFPELKNNRWWDLTTANQNSMTLPDTLLVLERATHTRLTANYNPATQTEYPITPMSDPESFAFLNKAATGWPQQWRRAGSTFEYWPTTVTSPTNYRTVVVLYGVRKEQTLTSSSATYVMNELWHPSIEKCATALLFERLSMPDRAKEWWDAVDRDVTATLNLLGLEQMQEKMSVEIAGTPR